jgi:hypothetical protein
VLRALDHAQCRRADGEEVVAFGRVPVNQASGASVRSRLISPRPYGPFGMGTSVIPEAGSHSGGLLGANRRAGRTVTRRHCRTAHGPACAISLTMGQPALRTSHVYI